MPPSHHSSSSHSSHSSSHSSSSHSSSSSSRSYTSQTRTRTNQPRGWNVTKHGNAPHYNCRDHDYIYYAHDWTTDDGVTYQAGYYDESGVRYTNVAIEGVETILSCKYCGATKIHKWQEGMIPNCECCGAPFEIDKIDAKKVAISNGATKPFIFLYGGIIALSFTFTMCSSMLRMIVPQGNSHFEDKPNVTNSTTITETTIPRSVYVKEISRSCPLDGEDYYDSKTQCWFWWDTNVSPNQWQYWYEGISSDYGDYGWMEYDDNEQQWYIEVSDGNWQPLPEKYDTSNLWHFENAYINDLF